MTRRAVAPALARRILWPAMGVMGLSTLMIVRRYPDHSMAGESAVGALALLLPGFALGAAGLVNWAKRPSSRSGGLLVVAGLSWLVVAWNNPGIGWAPAFTLGLLGWALCPTVVAHAVVTWPAGRMASRIERLLVVCAYANALLILGLLPTLTFDPAAAGCSQCPGNLVGVADLPYAAEAANRLGRGLGLIVYIALAGLAVGQLRRSSPAMRTVKRPVALTGAVYLGLVAAGYAHQLSRLVQGADALDRRLWIAQGVALVALAAGVGWGWVRAWRTRTEIARLVIDLAAAPPAGGLRDALARMLGDDTLRLAYPLTSGELVDARGTPLVDDRPASVLARGDQVVAVLTHRPGLLDDPATVEEVAAAARLVLDNERLQAELAAQLAHLRSSRQRIVAAADAERRRLERDLHDGAQQGLVTLLLQLRLGISTLGPEVPHALSHARAVESELECAIEDLRELAHGIFPAVLADEGLTPAIDAYAEGARVTVLIDSMAGDASPDRALDPTIEGVAYFIMAESIEQSAAQAATVSVRRREHVLSVGIDLAGVPDGAPDDWLLGVEDRVGAVDGRLAISGAGTGCLLLRAEIPCAW